MQIKKYLCEFHTFYEFIKKAYLKKRYAFLTQPQNTLNMKIKFYSICTTGQFTVATPVANMLVIPAEDKLLTLLKSALS